MIGLYSMFMLWKNQKHYVSMLKTLMLTFAWRWICLSVLCQVHSLKALMSPNPWDSLFEKKVLGEKVQIRLASWTLEASSKTLNLVALDGRVHWYQYSFLQGHIYWKSVAKDIFPCQKNLISQNWKTKP